MFSSLLDVDFGLDVLVPGLDLSLPESLDDRELVACYTLMFRWAVLWDSELSNPRLKRLQTMVEQVTRALQVTCLHGNLVHICRMTEDLYHVQSCAEDDALANMLSCLQATRLEHKQHADWSEVVTYLFRQAACRQAKMPANWDAWVVQLVEDDKSLRSSFVRGNVISAIATSRTPDPELFCNADLRGTLAWRLAEAFESGKLTLAHLYPAHARLLAKLVHSTQSRGSVHDALGSSLRDLGLTGSDFDFDLDEPVMVATRQTVTDQQARQMLERMRHPSFLDHDRVRLLARWAAYHTLDLASARVVAAAGWRLDHSAWTIVASLEATLPPDLGELVAAYVGTSQVSRPVLRALSCLWQAATSEGRQLLSLAVARCSVAGAQLAFKEALVQGTLQDSTGPEFGLSDIVPTGRATHALQPRWWPTATISSLVASQKAEWSALGLARRAAALQTVRGRYQGVELSCVFVQDFLSQALADRHALECLELAETETETGTFLRAQTDLALSFVRSLAYFDAAVASLFSQLTGLSVDVAAWRRVVQLTASNPAAALALLASAGLCLSEACLCCRHWVQNQKLRCLGFLGQLRLEHVPSDNDASFVLREAAAALPSSEDPTPLLERALAKRVTAPSILEHATQRLRMNDPRAAALDLLWLKQGYASNLPAALGRLEATLSSSEDPDVRKIIEAAADLPLREKAHLYAAWNSLFGPDTAVLTVPPSGASLRAAGMLVAMSNVTNFVGEEDCGLERVYRLLEDEAAHLDVTTTMRAVLAMMLDMVALVRPWPEVLRVQERVTTLLTRELWERTPRAVVDVMEPPALAFGALLTTALRHVAWSFPFREEADDPEDGKAKLLAAWSRVASVLGIRARFVWPPDADEQKGNEREVPFPGLLEGMWAVLISNLAQVGVYIVPPEDPQAQDEDREDLLKCLRLFAKLDASLPADALGFDCRFACLMTAGLSQLARRPDPTLGWIWDLNTPGWSQSMAGPCSGQLW